MASIIKYKSAWRALVAKRGVRRSKTFRTKREAESWAAAQETQIIKSAEQSPAQRHTLADLLTKYQNEVTPTKRGYRWEKIRIDFLLREFPDLMGNKLSRLHPHDLAKWSDARLRQVKSSTVLSEFGVLSTALEHARIELCCVVLSLFRLQQVLV